MKKDNLAFNTDDDLAYLKIISNRNVNTAARKRDHKKALFAHIKQTQKAGFCNYIYMPFVYDAEIEELKILGFTVKMEHQMVKVSWPVGNK